MRVPSKGVKDSLVLNEGVEWYKIVSALTYLSEGRCLLWFINISLGVANIAVYIQVLILSGCVSRGILWSNVLIVPAGDSCRN